MSVILEARNLVRDYHIPGGLLKKAKTVHALKGVSFSVEQGKTLAIVGESGCGKSTLGRILTLIDPATSGANWMSAGFSASAASVMAARRQPSHAGPSSSVVTVTMLR